MSWTRVCRAIAGLRQSVWWRTLVKWFLMMFLGIAVTIASVVLIARTETGSATIKQAVFVVAQDLERDAHGHTNLLLLGRGGWELHANGRGHKLTDAIMVASIDWKNKSVSMLSMPRDLYVETKYVNNRINTVVRDTSQALLNEMRFEPKHAHKLRELTGDRRQHYWWEIEAEADQIAVEALRDQVAQILDIEIHKYAMIDFQGFIDIVDLLGGITITNPKKIDDPNYPTFDWGTERFFLAAGEHTINGETALKFARSRHDSSDFERSARQQEVLRALKSKATSLGVLTSPASLRDLYSAIAANLVTDIYWSEMLSLAQLGTDLERDRITSYNLHDDPNQMGGFLVTPDRELYGGAFVLVPWLNLTDDKYIRIRQYAYLTLFQQQRPTVTVLNGNSTPGVATELATNLTRFGWNIDDIDDADNDQSTTTLYYSSEYESYAQLIKFYMKQLTLQAVTNPDLFQIIIGQDYTGYRRIPLLDV